MKPSCLSKIIHHSIGGITNYHRISAVDEYLVALTFLMEGDGWNTIHHDVVAEHGMMKMSKKQLEHLLMNHVRVYEKMVGDIFDVSYVDVANDSMDDMFQALSYNLSFQAIITWCYYRVHMNELPSSIEEVVYAYFHHWRKDRSVGEDEINEAMQVLIDWLEEANES